MHYAMLAAVSELIWERSQQPEVQSCRPSYVESHAARRRLGREARKCAKEQKAAGRRLQIVCARPVTVPAAP